MNLDQQYESLWHRKLTDPPVTPAAQSIDRVRWVTELWGPEVSGPLLDLGCGTGLMLAAAQARGWICAGVDISERVAAWLRTHGFSVWATSLDEDDLSTAPASLGAQAGVVTLCDVIEHVVDPLHVLQSAWQVTRTGGRLYVGTPNCAYWRRVMSLAAGRMFRTSGDPEGRDGGHVAYYGPVDLADLIREAGWSEVRIHYRNCDDDTAPPGWLALQALSPSACRSTYMIAEAVRP